MIMWCIPHLSVKEVSIKTFRPMKLENYDSESLLTGHLKPISIDDYAVRPLRSNGETNILVGSEKSGSDERNVGT